MSLIIGEETRNFIKENPNFDKYKYFYYPSHCMYEILMCHKIIDNQDTIRFSKEDIYKIYNTMSLEEDILFLQVDFYTDRDMETKSINIDYIKIDKEKKKGYDKLIEKYNEDSKKQKDLLDKYQECYEKDRKNLSIENEKQLYLKLKEKYEGKRNENNE